MWRIRGTTYESVDLGRVMGSERDNVSDLCMFSVFVGNADENAVPRGEREEALEDVEREALLCDEASDFSDWLLAEDFADAGVERE